MIWYNDKNDGIVISTRIRLARNLDKTPFPSILDDGKKAEVTKKLFSSVLDSHSALAGDFDAYMLDDVSRTDKISMLEEHLISPEMINGKGHSVLVNKSKTMSIMFMEEDHIRLQVIMGGSCLDKAYETASRVDDVIEESLSYAFDEKFGYLTACPTNAGTGMRASLMMHLPALTMTGNIDRVIRSVSGVGITVRGLYGEGTEAEGGFYQISNQITMGLSEREIIDRLSGIAQKLSDMEKQARQALADKHKNELEDKLFRSYGILKYARSIASAEAKNLLSDVMLAESMGIIKPSGKMTPLEMIIKTSPSVIMGGQELSAAERDRKRAEIIRNNI